MKKSTLKEIIIILIGFGLLASSVCLLLFKSDPSGWGWLLFVGLLLIASQSH